MNNKNSNIKTPIWIILYYFPILTSGVQWVLWILLFSSNGEEEFPHKVRHIALLGQAQCTILDFLKNNNIYLCFSINLTMSVAVLEKKLSISVKTSSFQFDTIFEQG